jgi:hypothetical protein
VSGSRRGRGRRRRSSLKGGQALWEGVGVSTFVALGRRQGGGGADVEPLKR